MSAERRRNKRIDVFGDYFYYQGNKDIKLRCKLKNISATGACISSSENINTDDIIFLHIQGAKDIDIKTKVVWKIKSQYGLLFVLDSNEEFENISYIMNYII